MKKLKLAEAFGWTCSICLSPGDPSTGMCTHCGIFKSCDHRGNLQSRPSKPQKPKRRQAFPLDAACEAFIDQIRYDATQVSGIGPNTVTKEDFKK